MRSQASKDRRKATATDSSEGAVHALPLLTPIAESQPEPSPPTPPPPPAERARRAAEEPAPPLRTVRPPAPPVDSTEPLEQPQFGVTLRRARERKAMSVHDLATLTRISARWIAALEQERFEQLPATVFVVGYVRNLARALGVDPSDLLSRYRAQRQTQDAALLTAASGGDRFETAMRQRKYLVFTVLAVAVGLLALLGLLLQRRPG
ncbi:MAG: helix-turn-helix domain-containing protein [Deltaproteobacteria bacterium]|nr:helix-turn-helix domain-containing protein [Deltaproteobacteria bacterium]